MMVDQGLNQVQVILLVNDILIGVLGVIFEFISELILGDVMDQGDGDVIYIFIINFFGFV